MVFMVMSLSFVSTFGFRLGVPKFDAFGVARVLVGVALMVSDAIEVTWWWMLGVGIGVLVGCRGEVWGSHQLNFKLQNSTETHCRNFVFVFFVF